MKSKPIVGIITNQASGFNGRQLLHAVGQRYVGSVMHFSAVIPTLIPTCLGKSDLENYLAAIDGVVLTGGRANIEPHHFGGNKFPDDEPIDPDRDRTALDLIDACVKREMPIFGICRGIQEMGVAFGSTLHPEIRDLPGRMNHRAPRLENGDFHPDPKVVFTDRHEVRLTSDGVFARIFGCEKIRVNSLHGQAITEPGKRIVVEGLAEDGTIEAVRIADAAGFALGVQWHAEHDPQTNPINRALFRAFGKAVRDRKKN